MKTYLFILPIAVLVTYSQIIVKWRVNSSPFKETQAAGVIMHILSYLADPIILSAYAAALLASFAWLFVVTKLPLATAFPIYIGTTFIMVLLGGWVFLAETMTITKIMAILLIFAGIAIGVRN